MPFYFTTGADLRVPPDVDAEPTIEALRAITTALSTQQSQNQLVSHYAAYNAVSTTRTICDTDDSSTCTGCKALSALFLAYTEAHVSSLSHDPTPRGSRRGSPHMSTRPQRQNMALRSSWVGLVTAAGFYLNAVMLLWNGGNPEDPWMFRRLIRMLKKDIALTEEAALRDGKGTRRGAFWFWKVFMGAYALQRLSEARGVFEATPPTDATGDEPDTTDSGWFDARVRRWSQATKVTEWSEARKALMQIVYPSSSKESHMPNLIWRRAVSAEVLVNLPIDPSLAAD